MDRFQQLLLKELQLETVEPWKRCGENWTYKSNIGPLFAKVSSDHHAEDLLKGEYASLQALEQANVVRVPKPLKVISDGQTMILVTEYLNFRGLDQFQGDLGEKFAKLHLHNISLLEENSSEAVQEFGFKTTTCCGKIPINNNWNGDWADFYCNQRLKPQVEMALKSSGCAELGRLWDQLKPLIRRFFEGIRVLPSLLHGDLWSGNAGETDSEPVIFDPASFYGHHEFDLAITRMFGGFRKDFYRRYHQLIPRAPGFEEREPLYELFHYLNHWNHFGGSYRDQSLSILRKLVK